MKLVNFRINSGLSIIVLSSLALVACGGGAPDSYSGAPANTKNTGTNPPAPPGVNPPPVNSNFTLTVTKSGSGSGTIASSPAGISSCSSSCSASYAPGTKVTLTATQATGSTFTAWSGGGCPGTSTSTCVTTMSQATNVTATFVLIPTGTGISPAFVPSRLSGVAPLSVFFDATSTTDGSVSRPFHDLEYRWDFKDTSAGTWANGAQPGVNSKNSATGPVASHVFETPGTYDVTLTALDGTNNATTHVLITVDNPDTVFAGSNTTCVGASSTPTQGVGGCPANAATVQQPNFVTAISSYATTGKRVLFQRGDTFTAASSARINTTGPGIVGAFGTAVAAPIVQMTGNVSTLALSSGSTPNIKDWRIMDLDFDGMNKSPSNGDLAGIDAQGGFSQMLALRMKIRNIYRGVSASHWQLSPGQNIYDEWSVVDSTITPMPAGCNGCDWRVYITGKRTTIQGNFLDNMGDVGVNGGGSHVIRSEYTAKGVISNNTISKPGTGVGHAIKIHGWDWVGGAGGNATANTYTEQVIISDNKIIGAQTPWTVALGPQDDSHDERLRDFIVERNWFTAGPGTQVHIYNNAVDTTIRNNIIDMTGAAYHTFITVTRRGLEPVPSNVHVYNNTFYSGSTGDFEGVLIGSAVSSISVINNLGSGPSASGQVMITGTSGLTQSNNLLNNSPMALFGTTTLNTPASFGLKALPNPARDAGLSTVHELTDFFLSSRPFNNTIDIGAVEGL